MEDGEGGGGGKQREREREMYMYNILIVDCAHTFVPQPSFTNVESWLDHLELGRYNNLLKKHGVNQLFQVPGITEEVQASMCSVHVAFYFVHVHCTCMYMYMTVIDLL